jgi:hypothetical protein
MRFIRNYITLQLQNDWGGPSWDTPWQRNVSELLLVLGRAADNLPDMFKGWGAVWMTRRFLAFLFGTEEAVPGDYVLALVATFGAILAILVSMI